MGPNAGPTAQQVADRATAIHAFAQQYADQLAPRLRAEGAVAFAMLAQSDHRTADTVTLEGAEFGSLVAEIVHVLDLRHDLRVVAGYASTNAVVAGDRGREARTTTARGAWSFRLADEDSA